MTKTFFFAHCAHFLRVVLNGRVPLRVQLLRLHLGVDKWLLLGGSWGVTLALAYAQTFPNHVSAIVLRGICLMRRCEVDWVYRGVRHIVILVVRRWLPVGPCRPE